MYVQGVHVPFCCVYVHVPFLLCFPSSEDDNSLPKKQMEVLSEVLKSAFFTSVKDVSRLSCDVVQ